MPELRIPCVGAILTDGGRILLISSVVAYSGSAGQVNYGAAKAGLVGLARSLAISRWP